MRLRFGGRTVTLTEFERDEFKAERWRYGAGEQVLFLAPTQQGKTTFAYELIEVSASPKLPALSLIMKPRDAVPSAWLAKLGHPVIQSYPVPRWREWWRGKPSGYGLWPRRTGRVRADNFMLADRFGSALDYVYNQGNHIVFADEGVGLTKILKLEPEMVALYTQGSGMGAGAWTASQKPSHLSTFAYGQAEHLLLGPEPDARNRKRFGEIGGVDPKLVEAAVMETERYGWTYLRRTGNAMCYIRP